MLRRTCSEGTATVMSSGTLRSNARAASSSPVSLTSALHAPRSTAGGVIQHLRAVVTNVNDDRLRAVSEHLTAVSTLALLYGTQG
jgi:hypothetical protein